MQDGSFLPKTVYTKLLTPSTTTTHASICEILMPLNPSGNRSIREDAYSLTIRIPFIAVAVVTLLLYWVVPQDLSVFRTGAIVTAWLGCGLLVMSLFLMVREPRLAKWLGGLELMHRWHHRLGIWAYLALLVHPLALAIDGWSESPLHAWETLSPWTQGWPNWWGWASLTFMMAGLTVALWPKMPYAAWRKLHHLLTVAVVFGTFHLIVLGLELSLLWVPLLMITLLLWRVLRADYGLGAKPYWVSSVESIARDVVEVTLRPLVGVGSLEAKPGQFVLVAFLAGPRFTGSGEYHPFTISAIGADGSLAMGIKGLGDCTSDLQQLKPGGEARVQGPFGSFLVDVRSPSLWVAGGIGITPFLSVLRNGTLDHAVDLIYLYRDQKDGAYAEELKALALTQPNFHLRTHETGVSVPDLRSIFPSAEKLLKLECFLCGPGAMIAAATDVLRERGVHLHQIHFERFDFR